MEYGTDTVIDDKKITADRRSFTITVKLRQITDIRHLRSGWIHIIRYFKHVGYLWARFEYFQVRFVLQPILVTVTEVFDRA